MTPERQTSSNEHLCTNLVLYIRPDFDATINKTKLPLQVLAVAKGNSEKNKDWDEACDGVIINHIKHKTLLLVCSVAVVN